MSTRSIIMVTGTSRKNGRSQTYRLYKHSDGYPTGNLPIIAEALEAATKVVKEAQERFPDTEMSAETVVGKVLGAATSEYGMGARIDAYEGAYHGAGDSDSAIYQAPLAHVHFGDQSDVEWMYVIDIGAKNVLIFGGSPCERKGSVDLWETNDPFEYLEQLREECREDEKKEMTECLKAVWKTGFKVNGVSPEAAPTPIKRKRGRPPKGEQKVLHLVEKMATK